MHTDVHLKGISRRSFLRFLGWGSFFIAMGASLAGAVRFLFPRVLFEKPSIFTIGFPDDFKINGDSDYQVYESWKAEQSIWIVREKNRIYALQSKCTHLGCTPNWFADERVFKCPCHGSQYYSNGVNFAGPATRPLERLKIFLGDDGRVLIDKSRVFTFKEFDKRGAYVKI